MTLSRAEENKVKGGRRRAVAVIDGPWGRRMLIHRQSTTFYVQTIANGFLAKLNRVVKADFEKAIVFYPRQLRAKIISPWMHICDPGTC